MMQTIVAKGSLMSVGNILGNSPGRIVEICLLNCIRRKSVPKCLANYHLPVCHTICSHTCEKKFVGKDLKSLLSNIKLKERHNKYEQRKALLEFDPKIEKRLMWKKRLFLGKDVYMQSSFCGPKRRVEAGLYEEDEFSEADGDEDSDYVDQTMNNKLVKHGKNINQSQQLKANLKDLHHNNLSDEIFFQILDETLMCHYVPDIATRKKLIDYCHNKFSEWRNNQILKVCDWWHLIDELEDDTFKKALAELSERDDLQIHQLVQVFYFVSFYKHVPIDTMSKFVAKVENSLHNINMQELTIICEGFLKCRPRITSKLLAENVLQCIQSTAVDQSSEYHLVTILRFLSRSYERNHSTLQGIAALLQPLIPSLNFVAVPHIAAAFAKLRCFHHGLYNTIAERCLSSLSDSQKQRVRSKDIWMLLWAFGRLNYMPPDSVVLFDLLVKRLTMNEESSLHYPIQQLRALVALSFLDIYPLHLIDRTFDKTFLKACQDCNFPDVYKQLVILDNSVRIERPQYNGNRLPEEFRRKSLLVPHGTTSFTPELRSETKFIIETIAKIVGRRECLKTSPILPHIRTPVDVEVDLSGERLSETPTSEHRLSLPHPLEKSSQRCAILIQLQNNYRFTPRKLLGVHVMKKRQLLRLGYQVAEVPYYEWQPMMQHSEKRRMKYIQRKLSETADEKNHL